MPSEVVSAISSTEAIVSIVSGLVVTIIGIWGVRQWRRKMIGEKQYEAVHKLLVLARRFRGEFGKSRGISTNASEWEHRPIGADETSAQTHILNGQYARLGRLQQAIDIIQELEQAAWEAEVVTGEEIVPIVKPFGEVLHELRLAIVEHFDYLLLTEKHPGYSFDLAAREMHSKTTRMIFQSQTDELNERVDNALEELEQKLRKYIR